MTLSLIEDDPLFEQKKKMLGRTQTTFSIRTDFKYFLVEEFFSWFRFIVYNGDLAIFSPEKMPNCWHLVKTVKTEEMQSSKFTKLVEWNQGVFDFSKVFVPKLAIKA
jgi:hypothetical protein